MRRGASRACREARELRGQGTFEYVLLLGGVLLVVVLAIFVLQGTFAQSASGLKSVDLAQCKATAMNTPSCSTDGVFRGAIGIPDGTLCDCSNYNQDALPGAAEEEVIFSGPSSTLFFADAAAPSGQPGQKQTQLILRRSGKRSWLMLQHTVSAPYSGSLAVVLPISPERIERVWSFPAPSATKASIDGSGLTLLSFENGRLLAGQLFFVLAYLKPADFKEVAAEIRAKIPAVASARPSGIPAGFDEYVYPSGAASPIACLGEGKSCVNPMGPSCCSGLSCDTFAGFTCKGSGQPTPAPTPAPTPSPTPEPTSTPLPSPSASPQPSACAQVRGVCVGVREVSDVYRGCVHGNDAALDASCGVEKYCCVPKPSVSPSASPIATATPIPSALASPSPSASPAATVTPIPSASASPSPSASPAATPSATPAPGAYVACGVSNAGMCYKTVSYNSNNNRLGCPLGLLQLAENAKECSSLNAFCCRQPAAGSCESVNGLCIPGQPFYPTACGWPEFSNAPSASTGSCSPGLLCCKPSTAYQISAAVKALATPAPAPSATVTVSPSPPSIPLSSPSTTPKPSVTLFPTPTPTATPAAAPAPPQDFDSLSFTTGSMGFATSATASSSELSYVRVSSSLPSAFVLGTAKMSEFYYVTKRASDGGFVQGVVLYKNPQTGDYVQYKHKDAVVEPGRVAANLVKYAFSATESVELLFKADGIEADSNPDFADFVIFIPETSAGAQSTLMIDVGFGDSLPQLGSKTEAGVAYG